MKRIACFFASALSVSVSMPVFSQTVANCGASSGMAYYFDEPGWDEDQISDGAISLVRSGDTIDILYKDIRGMNSATSQGGQISLLDVHDDFVTVLVNYPGGGKELYTFDMSRRMVTWSQHKFGVLFDKAHTMIARCD